MNEKRRAIVWFAVSVMLALATLMLLTSCGPRLNVPSIRSKGLPGSETFQAANIVEQVGMWAAGMGAFIVVIGIVLLVIGGKNAMKIAAAGGAMLGAGALLVFVGSHLYAIILATVITGAVLAIGAIWLKRLAILNWAEKFSGQDLNKDGMIAGIKRKIVVSAETQKLPKMLPPMSALEPKRHA